MGGKFTIFGTVQSVLSFTLHYYCEVMQMVKVLVVGYGVIGQRLADGVALQNDMELVGVVDAAPTLSVRALRDRGMPYKLFAAFNGARADMENAGLPVSGTLQDVLPSVD